jgi:hypothetical protein
LEDRADRVVAAATTTTLPVDLHHHLVKVMAAEKRLQTMSHIVQAVVAVVLVKLVEIHPEALGAAD